MMMLSSSGAAGLAARQRRRIMASRSLLTFIIQESSSSLTSASCLPCRSCRSTLMSGSTFSINRRNQISTIVSPPSRLSHSPQHHHGAFQLQLQQKRLQSATTATTTTTTTLLQKGTATQTAAASRVAEASSSSSFHASSGTGMIPAAAAADTTSSMNAILEDWCNACKNKAAADDVRHPMEMLAWVDKLQQQQKQRHHTPGSAAAAVVNTQTYTFLMDGALVFFAKNKKSLQQREKDKRKGDNAYTFVASLLERMLRESNMNVAPNVTHFHKVMTAAVKHDNNNIVAAEEWLVRLLNLYRSRLQQQQQQHDKHQQGELYQQQGDEDDDDALSLLAPTVDSFAIVIAAWSKIGFPKRAEYALQQLRACHAEFSPYGLVDLQPRREHYESCISAWLRASYFARRKQQQQFNRRHGDNPTNNNNNNSTAAAGMAKIAGHRAENLLLQMLEQKLQQRQQQQNRYDIRPSVHSLFKILTCWVQAQTPTPPSSSSSSSSFLQNENHHHSAAANSNNSNNIMAAQRATAILKLMLEMQQEEQDGKQEEKGDDSSSSSNEDKSHRHNKQEQDRVIANAYVRVIQAWSSCCSSLDIYNDSSLATDTGASAPINMVERLLRQLQDRMDTTTTTMTGHTAAVPAKAWQQACAHAIAAWGRVIATAGSNAQNSDVVHVKNAAVERAQAIFDGVFSNQRASQQKQTQHGDDDHDDNDDCVVDMYNELLHVYRLVGDGARAEALLRRRQQHRRDSYGRNGSNNRRSNKLPKPNPQTFYRGKRR
jgi:hypothetical protein